MTRAHGSATAANHTEIAIDDLVRALMCEAGSMWHSVLDHADELTEMRARVESVVDAHGGRYGAPGPHLGAHVKSAIDAAFDEAKACKAAEVGPEFLLLGILAPNRSHAEASRKLFSVIGANAETIRRRLHDLMASPNNSGKKAPS